MPHTAGVLVLQEDKLSKKLRGFEANPFKIQDHFKFWILNQYSLLGSIAPPDSDHLQ